MNGRVLVVEDESMVAMMVQDYLVDEGYEVVALAGTLDDALNAAEQCSFDVALLDVNLAGTPSFPVAEVLEARGIPYMFLTGYGPDSLPERLKGRYGLQKPFKMRELRREIERVRNPSGGAAPGADDKSLR